MPQLSQPDTSVALGHFIYFSTSEDAAAVAQILEREGWDIVVQSAEDVWLVAARCLRVLTGPLIRETRERLASLASAYDGDYDGWDAEQA